VSPINRLLFERARTRPEIMRRMAAQADRQLSPYDVVPAGTVMRWVVGAALRGRLSVVPSLFATGKRNAIAARARGARRAAGMIGFRALGLGPRTQSASVTGYADTPTGSAAELPSCPLEF
jgi:hypothetical protein